MSLADAADTAGTPDAERPARPNCPVRGRPRSEAVEHAIVEGVMRLLDEGVPLAELSIERIARTAGVGKATIYRRWSDKEALFVDVVRAAEPPDPELPGTSMRDDLVALLETLRRRGVASRSSTLLHNVFSQVKRSPKIWAAYDKNVVAPRRRLGVEVIRRGQRDGELRPDIDPEFAQDLFVGPMLLRSVMRPDGELPEGLSEQIVDAVLSGLRPVSSLAEPLPESCAAPSPEPSAASSAEPVGTAGG